MAARVKLRDAEDWLGERAKVARMRVAVHLDPLHSEAYKQTVAALCDALEGLLGASVEGEAEAIELAHRRLGRLKEAQGG